MPPSDVSAESTRTGTVLGIIALLLWSTSIAFVRDLTENIGPLTTAAYNYLLSGVVMTGLAFFGKGGIRRMLKLPPWYLFGCGAIFVAYTFCYYMAVGNAVDNKQTVILGLINYLWPSLTVLLAIPLLGKKARWWIYPGVAIALIGTMLAMGERGGMSLAGFAANVRSNWAVFLLALGGAVTWALYSNLARRWGAADSGGVPLFFLASGLVILVIRFCRHEQAVWTPRVVVVFLIMTLLTTIVAYMFWDYAMRRGNMVLVAILSNFLPLVATLFTCMYHNVTPGAGIITGGILVTAGAFICHWAMKEKKSKQGIME